MQDFHSTSSTLASFITSSYLLGYAFGPLVIAPLSEIYGRLPVYHTCNMLFLIFNIACAVAPNLAALIVFRMFAGIAGSCPVTIGAGSIADMVPHEKRGLAMASWLLGPLLGPSLGPLGTFASDYSALADLLTGVCTVAGGYLTMAKGWRWNFWVLSIAVRMPPSNFLAFLLTYSKDRINHHPNVRSDERVISSRYPFAENQTPAQVNREPRPRFRTPKPAFTLHAPEIIHRPSA